MNEIAHHHYPDATAMAEAVAQNIGTTIAQVLNANGEALVVLPGGRSPIPVFERLVARAPNWRRVTILPGDERLVPLDDPLSNAALLHRHFSATGARLVPLAKGAGDRYAAAKAANDRLDTLRWPPDLVWLGMGADGHTASLFPGSDLAAAMSADAGRVIGILPHPLPPEAPVARVSLTCASIASACWLLVTVSGKQKLGVLDQALSDGADSKYPIGRVLAAARGKIDIHWNPT